MNRMYKDVQTWNPFKGCLFDCSYCKPSFQTINKRLRKQCPDCYTYRPHHHEKRLEQIPNAKTVFVCGNGDVSFCEPDFFLKIIETMNTDHAKNPNRTFYVQTKKPSYLRFFLGQLPPNTVLVTTLETNRDEGYENISRAPVPSVRYGDFLGLQYPRKILTVEPIMQFDFDAFKRMILDLKPEKVWMGFNSHPNKVGLPEPRREKAERLARHLETSGIVVERKEWRAR